LAVVQPSVCPSLYIGLFGTMGTCELVHAAKIRVDSVSKNSGDFVIVFPQSCDEKV
jgi:hypothetical protein